MTICQEVRTTCGGSRRRAEGVGDITTSNTIERDVVDDCARLVRFDTSNFGGGDSRGEREAAEWVATELDDCGFEAVVLESAPRRASTVVRIAGRDRSAPALLAHAHLDVVPAEASDWSFDPFCGEVRDGVLLGRGTLDMKCMAAMLVAYARDLARTGRQPARDLVLAFVADEEDTGAYGANFLVDKHAELFEGVTTGIGESGAGLTLLPDGSHLYAIGTGERGTAWMTLRARGTAGHGSRPNPDNAVATLVRTVAALADIDWPLSVIPTVRAFLDGVGGRLGVELDAGDRADLRTHLGDAYPLIERTLANSLNPTMLEAGYKVNVIPTEAVAHVDGRILPGLQDEFFAAVDALLPASVTREFDSFTAPVGASHENAAFAAMAAAVREHDPDGLVLPFVLGGGTDAKAFAQLGIDCYGFMPGRTAPDFPAERYVHGVDEQIPVDSLEFGVRVLSTFLNAEEIS